MNEVAEKLLGKGHNADDLVIRDLFDMSFICEEHRDFLPKEGVTLDLKFDLRIDADAVITAMAYVNGECRGVATATTAVDGEPLFLMTISGEGAENVDVALVRGDNNVATAKSVVTYGANATMGTLKSPMVIRFVDEGENVIVYPTPFRNHLSIRAMAEASSRIDVYVTDVAGMRVAQWLDCNDNGMVEIVWNVDDSVVADGVYIVNVVIDGKTNAIKTVKR